MNTQEETTKSNSWNFIIISFFICVLIFGIILATNFSKTNKNRFDSEKYPMADVKIIKIVEGDEPYTVLEFKRRHISPAAERIIVPRIWGSEGDVFSIYERPDMIQP